MAGRFPLFIDEGVRGPLVRGLRHHGWDVVRALDVFPQGTDDEMLFEYAAKEERVFVSTDEPPRR